MRPPSVLSSAFEDVGVEFLPDNDVRVRAATPPDRGSWPAQRLLRPISISKQVTPSRSPGDAIISAAAAKAPLFARPVLPGLCRQADGGRSPARQYWGDAILRDRAASNTEAMGHRAVRRGLAAFRTAFRSET